MAALALDAGFHGIERELDALAGIRRVAAETGDLFIAAHQHAGCVRDICRFDVLRAQGEVESIDLMKVTDARLVELTVFLENVRLSCDSQAEGPTDGDGNLLPTVGHSVDALLAFPFDSKRVFTFLESENRMIAQNGAFGNQLKRVGHRCSGMRFGLGGVTGCANAI